MYLLDYGKHNKWSIKKWTNIDYHVKTDDDVAQKDVKKIVIVIYILH